MHSTTSKEDGSGSAGAGPPSVLKSLGARHGHQSRCEPLWQKNAAQARPDDGKQAADQRGPHPLDHAGLGCDGDSVSITAATQPSIEDVMLGAIPGLPKVHLHNPVLAYESGDDFMKFLVPGRRGQARSVRAGRRGLDPQREDQERRLLGGAGHRPEDRPADHDLRVDRPPGAQGAGRGRRRHLRHLRRHPRHGRQPDRLHGPGRLPRLGLEVEGRHADRQRARCPVQPDNFMETLLYLLYQVAGWRR